MSIVSRTEYKVYAGIPSGTTTWDALIDVLVDVAQGLVEDHCNRKFDNGLRLELYDGEDADGIVLRNPPIDSVTSVTLYYPDGSTEAVDATTWTFDSASGRLEFKSKSRGAFIDSDFGNGVFDPIGEQRRFPRGFVNIAVIYQGGYGGQTDFPGGLKLGMYQLIDELFRPIQNGSTGEGIYQSERLGDYQYTRAAAAELIEKFKFRFGPYRRIIA